MSDKTKSPGKFDELLGRISKLEEQIRSQQRAQLSDDQARELEKRIAALEFDHRKPTPARSSA